MIDSNRLLSLDQGPGDTYHVGSALSNEISRSLITGAVVLFAIVLAVQLIDLNGSEDNDS